MKKYGRCPGLDVSRICMVPESAGDRSEFNRWRRPSRSRAPSRHCRGRVFRRRPPGGVCPPHAPDRYVPLRFHRANLVKIPVPAKAASRNLSQEQLRNSEAISGCPWSACGACRHGLRAEIVPEAIVTRLWACLGLGQNGLRISGSLAGLRWG